MKILVTGGAGFIGYNLVEKLLTEGHRVIIVDKLYKQDTNKFYQNKNCSCFIGDICHKRAIRDIMEYVKPDVVVHLAAVAGVRNSFEQPLKYIKNNIEGTLNILECMKELGIKKLIFASSSSVYGDYESAKVFSEDMTSIKPISPYAVTKLCGEQLIYTYSKAYNISAICLRFFTVYGPRQREDLAIRKFATAIRDSKPIDMYGDGTSVRDYTYVDDIVDGILSAIEYNKSTFEIINLGGGNPISLKEMINYIEEGIGKEALVNRLPMQKGDVKRTSANISKAKKLLNYEPKVTFKEGIKRFIKWLNF